jgi:AcrR family transcriptional regulator
MSSDGIDHGGKQPTLAEQAVRRRLAEVEEAAQSDVRALMDAGLALMAESDGRRGPRVADIVAAAGLSNDSFYRYFASKDALVEAIVDQGAQTVISYVRHRISEPTDPADQLRAGVAAIMKQASDATLAGMTRAVLSNAMSMSSESRHLSASLVESLAELFVAPAAGLGSADPARTGKIIANAAMASMQYYLFSGSTPSDEDLDQLMAFLLAGTINAQDITRSSH